MEGRGSNAVLQLRLWASRTTFEGLSNLLNASSMRSRVCWTVILLAVTIVGIIHLVMSVKNFLESPTASMVAIDSAQAAFPSVTFCSLKPASESVLKVYRREVKQHLETNWGYFDQWFDYQRLQGQNESMSEYRQRMKLVFFQMLEVLWISDDIRDLGIADWVAILDCNFNGVKCGPSDFKLVQHYRYWNCYMFVPPESLKYANPAGDYSPGLTMTMFSDNNHFDSTYRQKESFVRQGGQDYHKKGMSLRQFLTETAKEFPLNEILDRNEFQTDGFQVIIHPSETYPMFYKPRFAVRNGRSSVHQVFSLEQNRLNQRGQPCRESSRDLLDHVHYPVVFGHQPDDLLHRRFVKGAEDLHHMRIQREIHRRCRCYSHRMPFQVRSRTELCYWAPSEHRKEPSPELLARIYCHDRWLTTAMDPQRRSQRHEESQEFVRPCRRSFADVQVKSTAWPNNEDLVSATVIYLTQHISNGTEFTDDNTKHQNHVLNSSDPFFKDLAQGFKDIFFNRKLRAFLLLLSMECGYKYGRNDSASAQLIRCLMKGKMLHNVLKINVRLASPGATVYNEIATYDSWELLSEIGGILGLWFGVSILSFFEIVELVYLIARPTPEDLQLAINLDSVSLTVDDLQND